MTGVKLHCYCYIAIVETILLCKKMSSALFKNDINKTCLSIIYINIHI